MTEDVWATFVRWVATWNVYGLPALLAVVAVFRWRSEGSPGARTRAARRLGLIHVGLAAWSATRVVDELWAYRAMGIFPSNPVTGMAGSLLAMAVDLPLGLGLLGRRGWSRWLALTLGMARLVLAGLILQWTWRHAAAVDLTEWPRLALSYGFPALSVVVPLWPGMAGVFRGEGEAPGGRGTSALAVVCLLGLVTLGSVVVTDAVDWALRAATEGDLAS